MGDTGICDMCPIGGVRSRDRWALGCVVENAQSVRRDQMRSGIGRCFGMRLLERGESLRVWRTWAFPPFGVCGVRRPVLRDLLPVGYLARSLSGGKTGRRIYLGDVGVGCAVFLSHVFGGPGEAGLSGGGFRKGAMGRMAD